jgi:hypothetical protein
MYEGAYYLTKIDDKWRRFYAVKGLAPLAPGIQSAKTSHLTSLAAIRLNAVNN